MSELEEQIKKDQKEFARKYREAVLKNDESLADEFAGKFAYAKKILGLLDGYEDTHVCVDKKQLQELLFAFPCQDVDNIYTRWLKLLKKVLGKE